MRIFGYIAVSAVIASGLVLFSCKKEESVPDSGHCQTKQNREIVSKVLGRTVNFDVILPPDFSDTGTYNVIYLLHGMFDDNRSWSCSPQSRGGAVALSVQLENMIAEGVIPPTVIVMPQAWNSFYLDGEDMKKYVGFGDAMDYETFFHDEFMPYVEEKYHIAPKRECRAIGGLSMGGYGSSYYAYGSSYYALKYPEKFCCLYAMSQAFFDPLTALAENADKSALPAIYIASGMHDMTVGQAPKQFSDVLNGCGIEHSYEEWAGGHDWKFWGECIPKFLEAFGKEFNK